MGVADDPKRLALVESVLCVSEAERLATIHNQVGRLFVKNKLSYPTTFTLYDLIKNVESPYFKIECDFSGPNIIHNRIEIFPKLNSEFHLSVKKLYAPLVSKVPVEKITLELMETLYYINGIDAINWAIRVLRGDTDSWKTYFDEKTLVFLKMLPTREFQKREDLEILGNNHLFEECFKNLLHEEIEGLKYEEKLWIKSKCQQFYCC